MDEAPLDVAIHAEPAQDGLARLVTRGLAALGRPELELTDVPAGHLDDAAVALRAMAQAVGTSERPLSAGARCAFPLSASTLLFGLIASENDAARLRVVDPFSMEDPENPLAAITSIAVERAASLLSRDEEDEEAPEPDEQGAEAILRASIGAFPGDPALRDRGIPQVAYNTENHLAYAMLARIDEEGRADWYRMALERSAAYEEGEMGCTRADLEAASVETLRADARRVLAQNLARPSVEELAPGVRMFLSPVWESTDEGQAARRACVQPTQFAGHYFEGATRTFLEKEGAALAAELLAGLRARTVELLVATREARELYVHDDAPAQQAGGEHAPHLLLLSLLLADVGRKHRAGFSADEIRASYEPSGPGAAALEKLEALRDEELSWYAAGM